MKYQAFIELFDDTNIIVSGDDKAQATCPSHHDSQNSLSISKGKNGRAVFHCFAGCSYENVIEAMGFTVDDFTTIPGCTLDQYSEKTGIPISFLSEFDIRQGIHTVGKDKKVPVVQIPWKTEGGENIGTHSRIAVSGNYKFIWNKGAKLKGHLYNADKLKAFDTDHIIIVEGESDVHTLAYNGFQAVGLPGADFFTNDTIKLLGNFSKIYIVIEPDQGGDTIIKKLAKSKNRDKVLLLNMGHANDPNELFKSDPAEFITAFTSILNNARSLEDFLQQKKTDFIDEQSNKCQHLLGSNNILADLESILSDTGLVNEVNNAKLVYLCLTSRILDEPVSAVVLGQSSAGKSFLVKTVLRFFPESCVSSFTSMTEKALCYYMDPLSHRFIYIAEQPGIENDFTSYIMRVLLSENQVQHSYPQKQEDGSFKTVTNTIAGPTGLITTTTKLFINPENATRVMILEADDSVQQTAQVIEGEWNEEEVPVDFDSWRALQHCIETGEHRVVIPYRHYLAATIRGEACRLRRDVGKLRTLIRVSAILHRETRERDSQGRIIASIADYTAVYDLFSDFLMETVGSRLKPPVQACLDIVQELIVHSDVSYITVPQVINEYRDRHLSVSDESIRRYIIKLVSAGYMVKDPENAKKKPIQYFMSDDPPATKIDILPNPEDVLLSMSNTSETWEPPLQDTPPTPDEHFYDGMSFDAN